VNARLLPLGDETAPRAWTPAVVKPEHLRALTPLLSDEGRDRSVLVADRAGKLSVVTPDAAADGCLAGELRLLATRADLLDAGLRESWAAGRLPHRLRAGYRVSDASLPDGADTEHDLRVRTRLAELAAERGISAETLLAELNNDLRSGRSLVPTEETPSKALPDRSAIVLAVRPADDVWGVVSLAHDGVPSAPRRPCGGEEPCPWRRDAPPGQFPAAAFELSAATSRAGSTRRFGCHSSTPARPQVCAGWLLRGAEGNAEVQALMATGQLPRPELPDGVELYDSYAEMAAANGVVAEQGAADLVPLQRFVETATSRRKP
jgi:hypothetical protein